MPKLKQLLFFGLFWAVCAGCPEGYIYAQGAGAAVEKEVVQQQEFYADEDPDVIDPDNYEEEVSGTFYDGFAFNDSLDKKVFNKRSIGDADWKTIRSNPEFQYRKEAEEIKKTEQNTESNWLAKFFKGLIEVLSLFLLSGIGKIILWLIVAAILCWLIFLVFKRRGIHLFTRSGKKIKRPVAAADETGDDFIPESWASVIQQAEANGNYRLAVRHSFRHIVHLMQVERIIPAERSLSNHQILSLLRQSNYYTDFRKLLRHYEYVWYGDFEVQEPGYKHIKSIYTQLSGQL